MNTEKPKKDPGKATNIFVWFIIATFFLSLWFWGMFALWKFFINLLMG